MIRFKRSERVGDLLKEEVSHIIIEELKDPRIGFITITGIKVSDDLKNAKIYYTVYGNSQDKEACALGLKSAVGFIKKELAHRVRLKYMPDLEFIFDKSIEDAQAMDELLRKIIDRDESL